MIRSLAWRSITSRKLRAALNGLGIVLGVALIFSIVSLSKTIVSTFDDLFSTVYGATDIIVTGSGANGTISASSLDKVRSTKGVEAVSSSVSSTMTVVRAGGDVGNKPTDKINTAGVIPSEPDLTSAKRIAGRQLSGPYDIELDSNFAAVNHFKVGQKIKVATQSGIETFTLVGIQKFSGDLNFAGLGFGLIEQSTARKLFDVPSGYSELDIKIAAGANVADVKAQLTKIVGRGVDVSTPKEVSAQINDQLQGFTVILYFFAGMALFAGGYLILNSFNMTVAQRLREIGMLRTLGSSRRLITRMILWEALFLGIIGAILGIAVGLLLTHGMTALVKAIGFPLGSVKYPPAAFIAAPVVGLIATLVGALRPAIRAGRIPPIQAVLSEHRAEKLRLGRRSVVGSALVVIGMIGVFILASSTSTPAPVVLAGVGGVIFLFTGVIMIGPVIVPPLVGFLSWPLRKLWPIEARIAADSARANPVRTASTASGLMIGIALVAAIGTLGSSFIGSVKRDLDKELKTDLTVQPKGFAPGQGPQQSMSPKLLTEIRALPDTRLAAGVRILSVTKGFKGGDFLAYGYEPSTHLQFSAPEYKGGTPQQVVGKVAAGQVTLPTELAKRNKIKIGDQIELSGPRGSGKFRVAATMSSNSNESSSIAMSNATFQSLFGLPGYSQIEILATSAAARKPLEASVNKLLRTNYPTFEALSNEQIKKQTEDQINQVFSIFYVIMAVAILVSLLGVINTLLMSVLERTREIGMLRALGTTRLQVRSVVAQEGLLLTLSGAILGLVVGVALGYAFVKGISATSPNAKFHPPIGVILGVAVLAVLFGLIASILPARRAARMNVIEAVSYE